MCIAISEFIHTYIYHLNVCVYVQHICLLLCLCAYVCLYISGIYIYICMHMKLYIIYKKKSLTFFQRTFPLSKFV